MANSLRVNPEELRGASTVWGAEVLGLLAAPPSLEPPAPWPTVLASAAVTGVAQAATADLHTGITGTAGATQLAATSYEANQSDAVDLLHNVVSTVTDAVRRNT
jgi:hypothetical protein